MADLISRDFIKSLGGECIAARDSKTDELLPIISIDALPPEDVQPVVQCKDCKHRNDYAYWLGCPILNTDDDNFCSYAERRTDEP